MSIFTSKIRLYVSCTLLILGWWGAAFYPTLTKEEALPAPQPEGCLSPFTYAGLSTLDRQSLQAALSGDFHKMAELLREWDLDAEILQSKGFSSIKRLAPVKLREGLLIARGLQAKKKGSSLKLLPQTYASAIVLLTLAEPSQIIAIPKGLRSQQLFFKDPMPHIAEDIDRFTCEKLFRARPDVAFVSAYYSHPSAIAALRSQGIRLCLTDSQESMEAIKKTIHQIGHASHLVEEARLLTLFVDAALLAIDNRLQALGVFSQPQQFLYLTYYSRWTTPPSNTFTFQLLRRLPLHFNLALFSPLQTLSMEQLKRANPDGLIIATRLTQQLQKALQQDLAFRELKASRTHKVFFLDDDIQQSASQFCVLAYYDLAQVLAKAKFL
jgi:iron complex transport system substrate-binding protein